MKLIAVALAPQLGDVIGIPLGAISSLAWSVSLHRPSSLASACGGLIPEKCRQAVPWSIGLAAWEDPGSGLNSHSWAWSLQRGRIVNPDTINGPLSKVKVLALLDTGANANFIKKDLEDALGLPLYGSLDVKVGNSTYTDASSITQPVTFDLEGSPFRVKCNSTPNLSYPFILGFPWLKECFLNFDHVNNRVTFTCNNALCSAPLNTDFPLSSPTSFQLTLLAVSHNESTILYQI
ncbi:hypothetical protein DSO57_1033979 [Entomophthora muscae]|uniref:Uncharacterized protein n=1 Tax=Entomophthora muscae TaxID=34485 RepID=A0ACC2TLT7_9FUNG|nr:hypothetical protein DSO57_1033979 [Entomophthora muscae]